MTLDRLNRRGGAAPVGRRTIDSTTANTQQKQQRLRESLLSSSSSPSPASDVAQSLQVAMPRLLLRFVLSMLLFAGIAAGAALYFSHGEQQQLAAVSSGDPYRFTPVSKTAASLQRPASGQQPSSSVVQVLAKYPHDASAFTQGLLVAKQGRDKFFIESTGLFGESTLRKVAIETGAVLAKYDLPADVFGEGVALTRDGEFVMLTWKSRRGFVFRASARDAASGSAFTLAREFTFSTVTGEGWGIDTFVVADGGGSDQLVVSDGSATLQFWDRATLREVRRVDVTFQGRAVAQLNELEVANGFVYANIWYQRVVAKIDPASGEIVAVFDCTALADPETTGQHDGAVLNGIAYDGDEDVFYLTGKLWNAVYKVRFVESTQ